MKIFPFIQKCCITSYKYVSNKKREFNYINHLKSIAISRLNLFNIILNFTLKYLFSECMNQWNFYKVM